MQLLLVSVTASDAWVLVGPAPVMRALYAKVASDATAFRVLLASTSLSSLRDYVSRDATVAWYKAWVKRGIIARSGNAPVKYSAVEHAIAQALQTQERHERLLYVRERGV